MKKILITIIILLLIEILSVGIVNATQDVDSINNRVNDTLDKIDFSEFDDFLKDNITGNNVDIKSYVNDIISGKKNIDFNTFMDMILDYLVDDIRIFLPLIITIISISILLSIVGGMSSNFKSKSTTEMVFFVCYITIIVATLSSVYLLMKDAIKVIDNATYFMRIIFPILLTLMSALGGVVTVSSYKPLMATLTFGISMVISKVVIPIFIATIVFCIVGNLSHNVKLDKINKALKSIGNFILGFIFSIFISFVTIEGITGSSIDNISIKSAKFAISSYVPILGGYLSDGFDLALASAVLIKNAIGYIGIIVILVLIAVPIVKIFIFSLALKLTAGIVEPIADNRISTFVYSISENMTLLIAILFGIAFMFLIMCMLVILSLNAVV